MFSNHENTVLNQIYDQLSYSSYEDEKYNKAELMKFIEHITILRDKDKIIRKGDRVMIDMCQTIKDYYYNPFTKGSNSIKAVLPAIFKTSKFIIDKYSKPIGELNITSKHFNKDKVWISFDENNKIIDCVTFFDNNFIFEIRYNILVNYMDYFVICESKYDYTGKKKKGKARGKQFGKVEIPQEAFIGVLKINKDQ